MEIKTLEDLKKAEVEILDFIHKFTEENNFKYWLSDGTLLGAVRHKGFIPWDDDIDVGMTREDYDRFVEKFNELKPFGYKVVLDRKDTYQFIKVISTENTLIYNDKPYDIFVDVFPFDYWTEKRANFFNFFIHLSKNRKKSFKNSLFNLGEVLRRQIRKKLFLKIILPYTKKTEYIGYGIECDFEIKLNKLEDMFPLKKIEFENKMYYVPKNTDAYLKFLYGDYMTLPPEESRVPSHFFK